MYNNGFLCDTLIHVYILIMLTPLPHCISFIFLTSLFFSCFHLSPFLSSLFLFHVCLELQDLMFALLGVCLALVQSFLGINLSGMRLFA